MALVAVTPCRKKARKQRATVTKIDGNQLQATWRPLAELKSPGFEWDGSHYPNPNKSGSPCKTELEMCADALLGLAQVAPSGYCCKPELKDTLMALHEDHAIMKATAVDLEKGNTPIVKAEKTCEVWQAMLKHCLILKQQTRTAVSPKLKLVLDALDDPGTTGITSAWTPPRSISATGTTPSLQPSRRDTIPVNADGFPDFDTLDVAEDADGDADDAAETGAARHVPFVHKTSLRRPPRYQGQP